MDLLRDMGHIRMKPWIPNNEILGKNEILYHLIFSVQSLGCRSFHGFIPAYASPSLQNSKNFRSVSPSNFRTQGFLSVLNKKSNFRTRLLSSDSVAKSATHKPVFYRLSPAKPPTKRNAFFHGEIFKIPTVKS